MTSFWRTGFVAAALCGAAVLPAACSNDDGADPKQCPVVPAFELTVTSVSGALPPDTTLDVKYGGGTESYRVEAGDEGQEVVLCTTDAPDGGDAGKPVTTLRCELWTQSVAVLTLSASGFPTLKRELDAVEVDKCLKTVPVSIVLGDADAGP